MRGEFFILLIVFIMSIDFISATYSCSEGVVNENLRELEIGDSKNVNGIYLGLSETNEIPAIKRIEAKLFIDSVGIVLTDNSTLEVKFMDEEDYNVSLVSSTESQATIRIDGTNVSIDEGGTESDAGFEFFLASAEGDYPGTASVKIIIGKSKLFLSNTDKPAEIVSVEGNKYGISLFSASDNDATIKVSKCSGDAELIWTDEETEEETEINITENDTNIETLNESLDNNISENILNESLNESEFGSENNETDELNKNKVNIPSYAYYIVAVIIFLIVSIFIIRYLKNNMPKEQNTENLS